MKDIARLKSREDVELARSTQEHLIAIGSIVRWAKQLSAQGRDLSTVPVHRETVVGPRYQYNAKIIGVGETYVILQVNP